MSTFLFFASLIAVVFAANAKDLSATSFPEVTAYGSLALVEFYAPWCPQCQTFEPLYDQFAESSQNETWTVARVNCVEEEELCVGHKVPIYPTLRVFHGQESTTYDGTRGLDQLRNLMKRHSHPLVTELTNAQDAESFMSEDKVVVVGYFDDSDVESRTMFREFAEVYRDEYLWGHISNEDFGRIENIQKPSIVLYKQFDHRKSKYTENFDEDRFNDFLYEEGQPLVKEIGVDLPDSFTGFSESNTTVYIFARTSEARKELAADLLPVVDATRQKLMWVSADPVAQTDKVAELAFKESDNPMLAIEDPTKRFKFALSGSESDDTIDINTVRDVLDKYFAGTLEPTLKSESIPTAQDGPVIDLVADSFQSLVMQDQRDSLVLFYSPTCKHCKAMASDYEELAELLTSDSDRIAVMRIDATKNDVFPIVTSYPTIRLYPADAKEEPITYEGKDRTANDLLTFLSSRQSSRLATRPQTPTEGLTSTTHNEL